MNIRTVVDIGTFIVAGLAVGVVSREIYDSGYEKTGVAVLLLWIGLCALRAFLGL